jgi:GT2 family glycosyltransferase
MTIYYFTPYSIIKDIGGAINEHCRIVPNPENWIVITDADAMFCNPNYGRVIHEALEKHGDDYGLIGCYTNRLRGLHQLHNREFSDNHNIVDHYKIAAEYITKEGITELKSEGVAGIFMAFKKSTWMAAGGFRQNYIAADTDFNQKVRKLQMKIGLINGLYMYHAYRPWRTIDQQPWNDTRHLIL